MATADEDVFITVNGQLIGSRFCKLRDYNDLFASAPRRGANKPKPLLNEIRFYPRRGGEKVCQLGIQVNGRWTEDNAPREGTREDWAEEAHDFMLKLGAEDEEGGILGVGLATVTFELSYFGIEVGSICQPQGVYRVQWETSCIGNAILELSLPPLVGLLAS